MPVLPAETARRVESLSASLRGGGLRLTHQRLEVVREIAGTDEHPDVETIYRAVRGRVPTISLDTVYRTLGVLAGRGLILRVGAAGGPVRYDANTSRHHHFVCTRCGLVRDVEEGSLDAWGPAPAIALPGSVESIEVQFRGVCWECRPAGARPARGSRPRRAAGPANGASQRKERHR
jgi:Fur family peroxide stress response transcriptional regulator